jgi:ABC-type transporter Mla MlaB component
MRRFIFITVLTALTANVFGQRYCGSELNLTELQQTDSARYQRIMNMENQLQTYLNTPSVLSIPQSTRTLLQR